MRRVLAAIVIVAALLPSPAAAATELGLRVVDRLDVAAPSVTTFPQGTTSIAAVVTYRELPPGSSIDITLSDALGARLAAYREPVREGGSGDMVARLLPGAALLPGTYVITASGAGSSPVSARFTVGGGGAPGAPGGAPGPPGAPVPIQLAPVQLAPLASTFLAPIQANDRPRGVEPGSRTRGRDVRFGLANILPDGTAVPGVAGSDQIAWMARARQVGAAGNRWELRWDVVESSPGVFDWAPTDRVVAANSGSGLPLLVVLIGTPAWAAGQPSAPPPGLDAPPILADGQINAVNVWGRFVHEVASRYRGRIAAYEVWNEPDRTDFWTGGPTDYYRLLSTAMAAVRHADPTARVVFGGLDGFRGTRFLEGVLDAATLDPSPPGRRGAFDALAWHAYHRPLDVYDGTIALRKLLRNRGLNQPIWITEANVAAWDDREVRGDGARPYRWSATAEEQAAYIVQTLAYAVAADVERIYLYRASDMGESEAWGLLRADGGQRPSERAFRFAVDVLAGATSARRIGGEGLERIEVDGPGGRATLLWATGPADAAAVVEASHPTRPAQIRDKIGGSGSISPIDGAFVLSLPGASADQGAHPGDLFVGGDPYVILESAQ